MSRKAWQDAANTCRDTISEAIDDGRKAAIAEAEYQAAKEAAAVKMRADGEPVGIVELRVKGAVNEKLYEREAARNIFAVDKLAISFYTNLEAHTFKEYQQSMEGR